MSSTEVGLHPVNPVRASGKSGDRVPLGQTVAYAAPVVGSWFYYIPMWSILPGFYTKYSGVPLGAIATCLLLIRLFDGFTDTTIGYLSDWHRSRGGTRKPWTIMGGLASIVACYYLFNPPHPATAAYYLGWSFAYFIAFTTSEIPHLAWASELTADYRGRSAIYTGRMILTRVGMLAFYALPLLPIYTTADYTPLVLRDAVWIGAVMTLIGITLAGLAAPVGVPAGVLTKDSPRRLLESLVRNKPLMIYLVTFACIGLYCGMWYGLLYLYLDGYLHFGAKVPLILVVATVLGMFSGPLWLKLIAHTSKSVTWALSAGLFFLQLMGTLLFVHPGSSWWIMLGWVTVANLAFSCHDVAALSLLGDIVDYGKLKFRKDRGATYFAVNILIFKIGLGIGGGVALGTAALLGYTATLQTHSARAILGLKLGFLILPACLAVAALMLMLRMRLNKPKHRIIERRLKLRFERSGSLT